MGDPPYSYIEQNVNSSYDQMVSILNMYYKDNNKFVKGIDDILNNRTPNFSKMVPTKFPSPNPNLKYDFMKAVNKSTDKDDLTTLDISNEDTYDLIIQQNTMYIMSSLACASLLIASIFIGKRI